MLGFLNGFLNHWKEHFCGARCRASESQASGWVKGMVTRFVCRRWWICGIIAPAACRHVGNALSLGLTRPIPFACFPPSHSDPPSPPFHKLSPHVLSMVRLDRQAKPEGIRGSRSRGLGFGVSWVPGLLSPVQVSREGEGGPDLRLRGEAGANCSGCWT